MEIKSKSKVILNDVGLSLAAAFTENGIVDSESIEALFESLTSIGASRDFVLDQTNDRLTRLLSNTANQTVQ